MQKKFFVPQGPSGSGKTTWCGKFNELLSENIVTIGDYSLTICSSDSYMKDSTGNYKFDSRHLMETHGKCFQSFMQAIRRGGDDRFANSFIVLDNTNILYQHVRNYVEIAFENDYEIIFIVFPDTPFPNIHDTPYEIVQQQRSSIENLQEKAYIELSQKYDWRGASERLHRIEAHNKYDLLKLLGVQQ